MYFVIQPEIAGRLGESTILDTIVHPPTVSKLDYEFESWPFDDILATFPCYIVTGRLHMALQQSGLAGFSFDHVTVTTSEQFDEFEHVLHPNISLPEFYWLKIHGKFGEDDFGISYTLRSVTTRRATNSHRREPSRHSGVRRGPAGPSVISSYRLVASKRAVDLLRQFSVQRCTIKEFKE